MPFIIIHVAACILYEDESYSFWSIFITYYTQDSHDIFIHVHFLFWSYSPYYPPLPSSHPHWSLFSSQPVWFHVFYYLFIHLFICLLYDPVSSFSLLWTRPSFYTLELVLQLEKFNTILDQRLLVCIQILLITSVSSVLSHCPYSSKSILGSCIAFIRLISLVFF